MSELRLNSIVKRYGNNLAVDHLSLTVQDGELVTLLGPSGCGKTTTLRSISGFLVPEEGDIYIGSRKVTDIPPERRGIGLVFQNYALWPHMTVYQNLAFGLQLRKMPKSRIDEKIEEVLATVKLSGYEHRYPRQLSGGQQQRVALARALVLEPDILLLDEPLSNLDALLREQMRFEIAQIHKRYGITTIYVTHDQTEAMVISDRIVILDQGRIMQEGKPFDIYSRPANQFVAGFMGTTSFLYGTVEEVAGERVVVRTGDGLVLHGTGHGLARKQEAAVAIRPENISFINGNGGNGGARKNVFTGTVYRSAYVGEEMDYQIQLGEAVLRAKGTVRDRMDEGAAVKIRIDEDAVPVLPGRDDA